MKTYYKDTKIEILPEKIQYLQYKDIHHIRFYFTGYIHITIPSEFQLVFY